MCENVGVVPRFAHKFCSGLVIIGAVLAGGASRRMGQPKAVLDLDGQPMGARVADALRAAGAERVLLVGGEPHWATDLGLEPVPDHWPGAGPLAGIATALSAVATGGAPLAMGGPVSDRTRGLETEVIVLVAACDQPDLSSATLRQLVDALGAARSQVAAAAHRTSDGRRHPFPSAWKPAAARTLVQLVESGARRADAAFEVVQVVDLLIDNDAPFADLDTPGEVVSWREER